MNSTGDVVNGLFEHYVEDNFLRVTKYIINYGYVFVDVSASETPGTNTIHLHYYPIGNTGGDNKPEVSLNMNTTYLVRPNSKFLVLANNIFNLKVKPVHRSNQLKFIKRMMSIDWKDIVLVKDNNDNVVGVQYKYNDKDFLFAYSEEYDSLTILNEDGELVKLIECDSKGESLQLLKMMFKY